GGTLNVFGQTALGGAAATVGGPNTTPGQVVLRGGTLNLLTNDTVKINNVNIFGNPNSLGLDVAVRGNAVINVDRFAGTGTGNVQQIGTLLMGDVTLTVTGGDNYRLQVGGTTTLQGPGSTFAPQPAANTVNGDMILAGLVTGSGSLNV